MVSHLGRRDFIRGTLLAAQGTAAAQGPIAEANRNAGMRSFRLAAVTQRSLPCSPDANLERTESWVRKAKDAGAAMVCFPELSVTGYETTPRIWEAAEPVPGPSTRRLEEFARKHQIHVAAGIAEKDRGMVYDTYVFAGPEGFLGKSRKMHIPPAEVGSWRGGGVPPVIDIGLAKAGVNICFDNWLPESSRLVGLQGAEIVFAPYVWAVGEWGDAPDHRKRNRAWKDYASRTFPARAIDNGVFFVALNACGPVPNGARTYYGNPVVMVYSPLGQLVAESADDAGDEVMVVAELDRKLLAARRSQGVFHPRFRRPEIYGLLAEGDIR
jgi:predicted amidohydrolase